MNQFLVRKASSGDDVAVVRRADTVIARTIGLLGVRDLPPRHGLWFEDCGAVHTIGMRIAIDIVFLDRSGQVVRACPSVAANRVAFGGPDAATTVELGCDTIRQSRIEAGDFLTFEPLHAHA